MYIALAFEPVAGGDPSQAGLAVDMTLAALGFVNLFHPVPGFCFANTPDGTKSVVDELQTELRKHPLTFTISATLKGWDIWRSTDVSKAKCRLLVDHAS